MNDKERIVQLEIALSKCRNLIYNLPNLDEDADLNDLSPEDVTAHIGGLMLQVINKVLVTKR